MYVVKTFERIQMAKNQSSKLEELLNDHEIIINNQTLKGIPLLAPLIEKFYFNIY
jgi:hypothetical protein